MENKNLNTICFIIEGRDEELHVLAKYLTKNYPIGQIAPVGNLLTDNKEDIIKEAIKKGCMSYHCGKLLHTVKYGSPIASYINLHDALYLSKLLTALKEYEKQL